MSTLKHRVFWAPFLVLLFSAVYSLVDVEAFLKNASAINSWLLTHFGFLYSLGTLFFVGVVVWVYFSDLGKVRIGGKEAKPILKKWNWFAITLCTTIATGILFWSASEPIFHLHQPPAGLDLEADSPDAARFAMSTMFMHWTFTPYAMYTLAALVFALAYYNLKQPYSLGAMLYPLLGKRAHGTFGNVVDAICLYSLVAGMAASLGAGLLILAGGMNKLFGVVNTPWLLGILAIIIVAAFIISAATGLVRGIRILSDWNIKFFIALCLFAFLFGPTSFILSFGFESFGEYLSTFFSRSLYNGTVADDGWANSWTIFYWANWLAWTPVTALFLGRLGQGYTVKEFIHFNLLYPALFGCFWMMVFSGTALHADMQVGDSAFYQQVIQANQPENAIYTLFETLPLAKVISALFLLIAFLSYITAADSNTTAMGGISSKGITPENPEPKLFIKVLWGLTIGVIAWVMVAFAGIDGIKMASTLGGFPALFLVIAVAFSLVRMATRMEGFEDE